MTISKSALDAEALSFAVRFYRFARAQLRADYANVAATFGLSAATATQSGALYAPPGDRLSANVQARCIPRAWSAFRRAGLVDFAGRAGSAESRTTMRDRFPAGLVWEVLDHDATVGLVAFPSTDGPAIAAPIPRDGNPQARVSAVVQQIVDPRLRLVLSGWLAEQTRTSDFHLLPEDAS